MKDLPNRPSPNPIGILDFNDLTQKQAGAYNALLTQIAKAIVYAQLHITTNNNLNKQNNAVKCWQYILHDLAITVLPEFFVVFQDKTTTSMQRRRLYDMTQSLYFAIRKRDNIQFLQQLAVLHDESAPLSHQSLLDTRRDNFVNYDATRGALNGIDIYMTGKGRNAKVAYQLREIANFVSVNGFRYMDEFKPYYKLILHTPTLFNYLQNHNLSILKEDLSELQKRRYLAFTIPSLSLILSKPELKDADTTHDLAIWLRQKYLYQQKELSELSTIPSILKPTSAPLTTSERIKALELTTQHEQSQDSGIPSTLATIIAFTFFTFRNILSVLLIDKEPEDYYQKRTQKFDALKSTDNAKDNIDNTATHINGKAPVTEKEPEPVIESKNDKNYDLPLELERHGYHLAILLSQIPTEHLKQLLTATNTLYAHLNYLQEAHPYLATRVDELIKDLTHNTLIRLDEMASQFVQDGEVNDDARQLFIEQHEDRIDKLIVLNLSQVNELNHSILEKKMAGFADVGNADERKFRNTIQELKILLRWLIAQQPDEIQATAHQVILDSLETTTLPDMQTVFFASETTIDQRHKLQKQLQELLNHFKQQTVHDIQLHSADESDSDSEIRRLLQLSKASDDMVNHKGHTLSNLDNQAQQTDAQQFIDLNHHYIKQLLMHW